MNIDQLYYILPEIFILSASCAILLASAFMNDKSQSNILYHISQISLLISASLAYATMTADSVLALHSTVVSDKLSAFLKVMICLVSAVVLLYSKDYLYHRGLLKGEYFFLILTSVAGMLIMTSAMHFITIYLGLELLSLSLYGLVAFQRKSGQASEAAMKYFVLGALASGLLLYGMSMIYGATGSLSLEVIHKVTSELQGDKTLVVVGMVFIVTGIAFKLGAVPFHAWVPDVYQGSVTPIGLFISTAPKLAAFAMMMRLLVDGLQPMQADWSEMLIFLAVLSIGFGNTVAIAQTNIKRMLAYSAISHVGFLLLGVLTGNVSGYSASLFYISSYVLMGLGSFGIILLLSQANFEADQLEDYKGLNEKNSWQAFIMLIVMLSMAGVPPLLGFWAKWSVLLQVVQAGYIWLAVYAVIFSVIGAFYYLRVIKLMYFDKPGRNIEINTSQDFNTAISINAITILLLGLFPSWLMQACIFIMQ